MLNLIGRARKQLTTRGDRFLAISGAVLLASGLGQVHAQDKGTPIGKVPEVTEEFSKELVSDPEEVVLVRVLKEGGIVEYLTGSDKAESQMYSPAPAQFSGFCEGQAECDEKFGDKEGIVISGRITREALGFSADAPITRVIPGFIVQVGSSSCWIEYYFASGSPQSRCVCVADGRQPDTCPR